MTVRLCDAWEAAQEIIPDLPERQARTRGAGGIVKINAVMLACRGLGLSFGQIGKFFNRDHSTVMHACRSAQDRRKADSDYGLMIQRIKARALEVAARDRQPMFKAPIKVKAGDDLVWNPASTKTHLQQMQEGNAKYLDKLAAYLSERRAA